MLGYFDMPDKTAETVTADGWVRTGDLAVMDERGYCRIVGRLKDMIIRGGENLFPVEIEEVLYRHPAVAEAAVVGLPDEHWGEVVGAFIRPRDPAAPPTVAELRSTCAPACHRRRHPRSGMPSTASRSPDPARSRSSPSARRGKRASTMATNSTASRHPRDGTRWVRTPFGPRARIQRRVDAGRRPARRPPPTR